MTTLSIVIERFDTAVTPSPPAEAFCTASAKIKIGVPARIGTTTLALRCSKSMAGNEKPITPHALNISVVLVPNTLPADSTKTQYIGLSTLQ